MQVVTFKTAERLRDSGFLQPDFQPNQFWYLYYPSQKSWHFICGEIAFKEYEILRKSSDLVDAIYAPTATELMVIEWFLLKSGTEEWLVFTSYSNVEDFRPVGQHSNPAEAAAMAWLYVHKKAEQ